MAVMTTATQFVTGCLVLGLGLFLLAGAVRDLYRVRLLPSISARTVTALGGVVLLAAGGYAARLAVPL
jgi:predicted metal-binding membrane protein